MGLLDKLKKKDKVEDVTDSKKSADVLVDKKEVVKKDKAEKTVSEKKVPSASITSNKILIRPLVSEKSAVLEQMGTYAFVVDIKANKFQVKEAIREVYGVMPKKVRILNVEGKRTSFGQRLGKRSDWKKAFIKLPKGKTINIHEGV